MQNTTQSHPKNSTRAGKKAQSVGAQLRRHGEQQTKEDVKAILGEWAELLGGCDLVFVSVPKAMRCVLSICVCVYGGGERDRRVCVILFYSIYQQSSISPFTSTNLSITSHPTMSTPPHHSGVLLGSGEADAPLLRRDDARIRPVPFMVEPPSFAEVRVPVWFCTT